MLNNNFASKLSKTPRMVLKTFIPTLGLRDRVEEILIYKYVNGLCVWDVADKMGLTYESTMNSLCEARKEMYNSITEYYDFYPEETKAVIRKLLE